VTPFFPGLPAYVNASRFTIHKSDLFESVLRIKFVPIKPVPPVTNMVFVGISKLFPLLTSAYCARKTILPGQRGNVKNIGKRRTVKDRVCKASGRSGIVRSCDRFYFLIQALALD